MVRARFHELKVTPSPAVISFEITGVDLCVVNAVRRCIMTDVPTIAFAYDAASKTPTGVRILKNTSCLHNEFVAHRMSLVPVCFDENQFRHFDPTHWSFVLRVKNTGSDILTVTTADIEVFDQTGAKYSKAVRDALFPPCRITNDHILLLRLRPSNLGDANGEEIHIECTATKGSGSQHARWCPTSRCFFRNKRDAAAADQQLRQRIAAVNQQREKDGQAALTPAEEARVTVQFGALDAHRCYIKDEFGDPAAFEFFLESECRFRATYIFFKSLVVLVSRLKDVINALNDPENTVVLSARESEDRPLHAKVTVYAYPNMDDFYHLVIRGEDHTLGNLLQGMLYRRWVRDGAGRDVSYIGYYQPHPLEDHIMVKVKCAVPGDDVKARMVDGVSWVVSEMQGICSEFIEFSGLGKASSSPITEVSEYLASIKRRAAAAAAVLTKKTI